MANTGRTTFKNLNFVIHDNTGVPVLRTIPIDSLSVVGVAYEEQDLTAWMDAVKNALPSMPDAPIEWGGPFDSAAVQAVGTLSGSHTVLSPLNGLMIPLTIDIQFGVRHAWVAGEPQFGITATATAGYVLTKYTLDPSSMRYSARAVLYPGSTLPAWGTVAEA